MKDEIPTPRTDAEAGDVLDANEEYSQDFKKSIDGSYVPSDFSRTLERELIAARAEIEKWRSNWYRDRKVAGAYIWNTIRETLSK